MSSLFASVYLDEDVDTLVADLIRARGFVAITAREAGQRGKSDPEQLLYATSRSLVLLSHNRRHFEIIAGHYYQTGQTHSGIILAFRRPPHEIARRVFDLLNQVTADEIQNTVRFI